MIVPGSPHAFMLAAAADPLDNILAIGHSVRLNAPDAAYFTRTPTVTSTRKKATISAWVKRAGLSSGAYQAIYNAGDSPQAEFIGFDSSTDAVRVFLAGGTAADILTTAVFRDPSAHCHVVVGIDTTQATASERIIIEVNGIRQAVTGTQPALDYVILKMFNSAYLQYIGKLDSGYAALYLSDVYVISDDRRPASDFGLIHPLTGQWRPKRYTGAYGTNGFHLDFSDGSAATSSTLGKDRSGNNNDWTPTNISVTAGVTCDWMLDTPTNNFATWNHTAPRLSTAANSTLTDGNLKAMSIQAADWESVKGNTLPYGKWYVEFTAMGAAAGTSGYRTFGLQPNSVQNMGNNFAGAIASPIGYELALYPIAGNPSTNPVGLWSAGVRTAIDADVSADADGTVYMMAADMTLGAGSNKVWWGRAGTWFNSGNPSTGANAAYSTLPNELNLVQSLLCVAGYGLALNAGQRAFAHAAPTGFKGVGTKQYNKPTTLAKPTNSFVAVTDSGANVQTTLAAARFGWTNYIEIFKRRDAAEGWRWRFASDLTNYLDSSSTAAKAAFPSLTGTSYVGYVLRVSPSCGVATGTFAHVNGVADTITDGLGVLRKFILLKREDAASDWLAYHPDLTAGKLLYLNLTNAETVDASISTVLSNSFVAAAALPTGTYRWVALAEVDGFLKLSKHTGNGSTDGSVILSNSTPRDWIVKRIDVGGASYDWTSWDSARSSVNAMNEMISVNAALAEYDTTGGLAGPGNPIDVTSNGVKIRCSWQGINVNAGTYISIVFAAFPFRYANAR